jgi:YebC/PmpR family DNA-binding regulatory protein
MATGCGPEEVAMSGHSKWAQIKRQKGVADARRGQLFTKLGREITVVARQGGPDPTANFRLRLAIQRARDNNMPADNIDRAIKRGAGGADAATLSEVNYEGYGPGGAAILAEALTDNRNRTVADVRATLARGGGSLGEAGCVAWLFESRGVVTVPVHDQAADDLAMAAIDAGAEDVKVEDDAVEVYTRPADLENVRRSLEEAGVAVASAELSMVPKNTVSLGEKEALQTLRLLDRLEELDDIQRVYSNADFPDSVLAGYSG